jgi:hypothetical protein
MLSSMIIHTCQHRSNAKSSLIFQAFNKNRSVQIFVRSRRISSRTHNRSDKSTMTHENRFCDDIIRSAESLVHRAQVSTLPSATKEDFQHYIAVSDDDNIYKRWPLHSERNHCHCCDISIGKLFYTLLKLLVV